MQFLFSWFILSGRGSLFGREMYPNTLIAKNEGLFEWMVVRAASSYCSKSDFALNKGCSSGNESIRSKEAALPVLVAGLFTV